MEQRELKFRSAHYNFDGTFNGFTYWGMLNSVDSETASCFSCPTWKSGTLRKVEEQYTVRKDKNGKDIYEGDINQDKGIVVWNNDSASFCWHYANIELMPFEDEEDWCLIVGNIHESPELLKGGVYYG